MGTSLGDRALAVSDDLAAFLTCIRKETAPVDRFLSWSELRIRWRHWLTGGLKKSSRSWFFSAFI